jgi:hypothetical protein
VAKGDNSNDPTGVPPLRVFVVLMAVLVTIGVVVLTTKADLPPAPRPTQTPSPDFSLTDAEAIARFKELRALRDAMYRHRDLSFLSRIYAAESPSRSVAFEEIRQLTRDRVLDRSTYRTHKLSVTVNTPSRINVVEELTLFPRFVASDRENVTRDPRPLRQIVQWVLVVDRGEWLIGESTLKSSRRVSG